MTWNTGLLVNARLHASLAAASPKAAALGLLAAAVSRGHGAALHVLLMVSPSSAVAKFRLSEGEWFP